ncbi:MAG: translation elongation factor Ts [Buchnera aphidicola (Schlechtendalia chinensis)]
MKTVTTLLVKKLRSQTGAGIVDCKKALMETKGDIEKSIDFLRKIGQVKASRKQSCIASNGSIFIKVHNMRTVMLELNCETDFVSKEDCFLSFGKEIINYVASENVKDIKFIQDVFKRQRVDLVSRINENVVLRRIEIFEGDNISSYLHHNRIGVLLKTTLCNNKVLSKNLAMHIAASKPEYLRSDLIPNTVIEREYNIQLELAKKSKKPESIVEKIVKGRMLKFASEKCLLGQSFIFNPEKNVRDIILENDINIVKFTRFEVGE